MNTARKSIRRRAGFTFVEVLAALVLIGVVLPVAMRGVSLSLQAAGRARHRTEAAELAHGKLNELTLLKDSSQLNGSGDFGLDWPEYRWESTSVSSDAGCYEVKVTVFWKERSLDESLDLSTLIYPGSSSGTSTGGILP